MPDLPLTKVAGAKITRLARSSHINTVEEEGEGHQKQYRLVRARLTNAGEGTDIEAIEQGCVSLTALYPSLLDRPPQRLLKKLCTDLQRNNGIEGTVMKKLVLYSDQIPALRKPSTKN